MYGDNLQKIKGHRRIVAIMVANEPGMLARISGLFMRRNFNIDGLTVGTSTNPDVSRMTISFFGDDRASEQLEKQLHKIVNVIKVNDLPAHSIIREVALIKVNTKSKKEQDEIMEYCKAHDGKIANAEHDDMIIEVVGEPEKVDSFIRLMKHYGVKEIARTGSTGMSRGSIGFEKD